MLLIRSFVAALCACSLVPAVASATTLSQASSSSPGSLDIVGSGLTTANFLAVMTSNGTIRVYRPDGRFASKNRAESISWSGTAIHIQRDSRLFGASARRIIVGKVSMVSQVVVAGEVTGVTSPSTGKIVISGLGLTSAEKVQITAGGLVKTYHNPRSASGSSSGTINIWSSTTIAVTDPALAGQNVTNITMFYGLGAAQVQIPRPTTLTVQGPSGPFITGLSSPGPNQLRFTGTHLDQVTYMDIVDNKGTSASAYFLPEDQIYNPVGTSMTITPTTITFTDPSYARIPVVGAQLYDANNDYALLQDFQASPAITAAASPWACPSLDLGSFMLTRTDTPTPGTSPGYSFQRFNTTNCSLTLKRSDDQQSLSLYGRSAVARDQSKYAYVEGGSIGIENVSGGKNSSRVDLPHQSHDIVGMAFSPDGGKLATVETVAATLTVPSTVKITTWNVNPLTNALTDETTQYVESPTTNTLGAQGGRIFMWSDNTHILYVIKPEDSRSNEQLRRLDLATHTATTVLEIHLSLTGARAAGQDVRAYRFLGAGGGNVFFAGLTNTDVNGIWKIPESGANASDPNVKLLSLSDGYRDILETQAAVSADGSKLAVPVTTADNELAIKVINPFTGQVGDAAVPSANAVYVDGLQFTASGHYLVGACQQGSYRGYRRSNMCAFNMDIPGPPILMSDDLPVTLSGQWGSLGYRLLRYEGKN